MKTKGKTIRAVCFQAAQYIKVGGKIMFYFTVEIANVRFGDIRRETVMAASEYEAVDEVRVCCNERIIAVWRL